MSVPSTVALMHFISEGFNNIKLFKRANLGAIKKPRDSLSLEDLMRLQDYNKLLSDAKILQQLQRCALQHGLIRKMNKLGKGSMKLHSRVFIGAHLFNWRPVYLPFIHFTTSGKNFWFSDNLLIDFVPCKIKRVLFSFSPVRQT